MCPIESNKQIPPVALITGGARRVGAAIVQKLHALGYRVIIHYRESTEEALHLCRTLNAVRLDSAYAIHASLSTEKEAQQLIQSALAAYSRLDVLVNNASVFIATPVQEALSHSAYETMWTTNVSVPYWLSEAAFPFLAQNSGSIVNLTDIHAEKPLKDYGVYCQTKAALKMQTMVFAKAYAPKVRVNAVAPGAVAWPEGVNVLDEAKQLAIIAETPLRCHGHPDWIAMAVAALIENPFITGQTLRVDGGRSLGSLGNG